MPRIHISVHIPKNGGMTFDSILARVFGRGFARTEEGAAGRIMSAAEKADLLRQNPRIRCLSGHSFRFPGPVLPDCTYAYWTFLREPIARLVSLYVYEGQIAAHNPQHSSHRPIEAWIDSRLQEDNALTNYQAFHLMGASDPGQVSLDEARQRLDSFAFVGVAEAYDDSLIVLAQQQGWQPFDLFYRKQNVTGSKKRVVLNSRTRQRLLDLNQIDLALYEAARQRLAQALKDMRPRLLAAWRRDFARIRQLTPRQFPWTYKASARLRRWRSAILG